MRWAETYGAESSLTSGRLRVLLVGARVPKAKTFNVAAVLAASGHFVSRTIESPEWSLTTSGRAYIDQIIPPPSLHNVVDVDVIRSILINVTDDVVRGYVDESITCLEAGALRAAIVFLWSGAIRTLHERAMILGGPALTTAVQKHDVKARPLSRIDDWSAVRDKTALLALRELAILDKGQWTTLQEALDLRNRCGHPTKYRPGAAKTRSFIEDVVGIVFQ